MSNKPITTAEQLVQIYINAEKKLTGIIQAKARASSPAAYERSLLKQIDEELRKLRVTSAKSVTELIEHFYESGLQQLVEQLAQVGENRTYNMFSKLNRRQIEIIARNTTGNFNKAIKMIGRRTQDTVRKITLEATAEKLTTGQTIRQMQKSLAKAFENEHLTCVEYSNGAKMPISKYAEMTARSTTAEAQNSSQFVQAKDWGYDLVKMTYHSPTCEVCAKYQGRVYATTKQAANGKYRDKDGKRLKFPYLYDTVLVKGYDTVHPNCRHRFSVYPARAYTTEELKKASQNSMREFTDDRSDDERKAYAEEQADKRRKNESLKQYEKLKAMFPDDAPKSFAGFVRMKNAKSERYRQLINDSRTITRLANERENGIIKADERMVHSSKFAVPKDLTSSRQFRQKFDSMDLDKSVQREYYQAAKEILAHRSGNNGEDLFYYNTRTKKWYKSKTGTKKGTPDYNTEILQGLQESNRNEIISFHNHPESLPPSDGDLNTALQNGYKKGYTIGHNGTIFEYTAPKYTISEAVYQNRVGSYKERGFNEYEAQLKTLYDLQKLYGFEFREVK